MKYHKYMIPILFLLIHCGNKEEKNPIITTRPSHIPIYAKQFKNGEWFLKDSNAGYLAHWLNDGTPILEAFLVNNLTERIIISYPILSNLKTFYRFKLLKKGYIPENIDDLINLEDKENYRKRVTKVYFNMYLYRGFEANDLLYPREFFNTVMWNSGPNIAFKDNRIYSFTCNTIKSYSPDVSAENCGTKFHYNNNSTIEKTSFPIKCNHSCSDQIDIIQKGIYQINEDRHANIYQDKNLDSRILKTIDRNGTIKVLENRINMTEINYDNILWVKVRSGKIDGYLLKSSISNRKL
ncbi:hypothetical protein EHQ24_10725 [Leptospira noumeaensis]|uniref:SH3 domain-containing protein n=1 Tax=Leptospira noumeaensis TaxID=2484964 RepID=A0A4R9I6M3_9LEPT|nr:hypothetical protein [Leptospira noumeaensis]TGK81765.1 hypothetical protein EHQ24_10725 [Leptospira noumeaensis]